MENPTEHSSINTMNTLNTIENIDKGTKQTEPQKNRVDIITTTKIKNNNYNEIKWLTGC